MVKSRILWLDDKVSRYGPFLQALRRGGFTIKTAETVKEAIEEAEKYQYDLALVDLKLEEGSGIDFLDWSVGPGNGQVGNICVLSSYLYLDQFRDLISDFAHPVFVLEKNFPDPDSAAFKERWLEKLRELTSSKPRRTYSDFEKSKKKKVNVSKPFEMKYDDYIALPSILKEKVERKARQQAEPFFKAAFESGYSWVLIIGSPNHIEHKAASIAEKLSPAEVTDLGIDRNRIPFQFAVEETTEDFCHGPTHLKSYPTVTLGSPSGKPSDKFTAHFDTGSYWSWISLEQWLDLTGDAELGQPIQSQYRGVNIDYYEKTLTLQIFDQATSGRRDIELPARLVRRWLKTRFVAQCPRDCSAPCREWTGTHNNCIARKGLIGRNLLSTNGIMLRIDGKTMKTSF